jgi:hypothetical protein
MSSSVFVISRRGRGMRCSINSGWNLMGFFPVREIGTIRNPDIVVELIRDF